MGGFGSGRPAQKSTFEDGLSLDLDELIRDGLVRPGRWSGTLAWRSTVTGEQTASAVCTAQMNVEVGTGFFEIGYRVTDWRGERHDVHEQVPLEGVSQRLGSRNQYFESSTDEQLRLSTPGDRPSHGRDEPSHLGAPADARPCSARWTPALPP